MYTNSFDEKKTLYYYVELILYTVVTPRSLPHF